MSFQFHHYRRDDSPVLNIPALGLALSVVLPPDVSDRALTVIETENTPGFGPPLHRHGETEVFRVLEGKYLFEVDGRRFEAATGDVVSAPGGSPHTFLNITDKPARQLVMILSGMDAQAFFLGLGEIFSDGAPNRDRLNDFGKAWGVEFLGPPLSLGSR